jgi:glutamyl-Q tRNA(Asp) synthetase
LPPVLRFAPSPNGYLHLGHALSALVGYRLSRELGGKFLIRIEDIDQARTREAYVGAIFEDLQWLGLTWETPILRQSQEVEHYRSAAAKLEDLGLLYPCFATRSEIAAAASAGGNAPLRDPDGAIVYPGLHRDLPRQEIDRRLAAGERPAMRIRMGAAVELATQRLKNRPLTFTEMAPGRELRTIEAEPQRWGDVIIQRKDFPASYHLAVVVDDARQGITHVTRGRDLFASTGIHRLLQVLLELPEPVYRHHRLLRDDRGDKLSKSDGARSLRELREAGWTPEQVIEEVTRDAEGYGGDLANSD